MRLIPLLVILNVLFISCTKSDTQPPSFDVDNSWQMEVDGKLYQGNIDTSFLTYSRYSISVDTTVTLTGSTSKGDANILMRLRIDRTGSQNNIILIGVGTSSMVFDTASDIYLKSRQSVDHVRFDIDGFTGKKLKGTFSGILISTNGFTQNITNGKVSLELGKGNSTPKFMGVTVGNTKVAGPVRSAVHQSNTLIIDGFGFHGDSTYQLQVRTGAVIKPGVYKSSDGDVGFRLFMPSIVTHYVSDSLGDLTVTIHSVDGNVVTGSVEGRSYHYLSSALVSMIGGQFRCRVKDYQPGADSLNQWKFSLDNNGQSNYVAAGGSILNATIKPDRLGYVLKIDGNSDNGRSFFNLVLRSYQRFAPGLYEVQSYSDSCYFTTPSIKYFNSNSRFYIRIDSISSTRLVGGFFGAAVAGKELYGTGMIGYSLRKGSFRTSGSF